MSVALLLALSGSANAYDPIQLEHLLLTRKCVACDLTFADLAGADLTGADVRGSDFTGANLAGTRMVNAVARKANFLGADLEDSDWTGANLASANLKHTWAPDALFTGAFLQYADLTWSQMRGANFDRAHLWHTQMVEGAFQHTSWVETDAEHVDAVGASFEEAVFSRARLIDADLSGADLRLATFYAFAPQILLVGADLYDSDFHKADIDGANLGDAHIVSVDFSDAHLDDIDVTGALIDDVDFRGASLQRFAPQPASVDWGSVVFDGADLREADLRDEPYLRQSSFAAVDFRDTLFDFHGLGQVYMPGADLRGQDFSGFLLMGTVLDGAVLDGLIWTGALLHDTSLRDTDLTPVTLDVASLNGSDLTGASCPGCDFTVVSTLSAGLPGVTDVTFDGASLAGAKFSNTILHGSTFVDADLTGAWFDGAHFRNVGVNGAPAAAVLDHADLTGAILDGAALDGASFRDATLDGASCLGCTGNADFTDASLRQTDFTGLTVPGMLVLDGADATQARFDDAMIRKLQGTRTLFDHAWWQGATVQMAYLDGADLWSAYYWSEPARVGYCDTVLPGIWTLQNQWQLVPGVGGVPATWAKPVPCSPTRIGPSLAASPACAEMLGAAACAAAQ